LAATLNFIPVVGPIATFVVLVLVGVVTAPTFAQGLLPAAGFALLIVVEGQFVTPTIIGRQLELNALAVLLSLAFWTWLWGPMGAVLSSPILMVALILKDRLYVDEEQPLDRALPRIIVSSGAPDDDRCSARHDAHCKR
jgi:predicted PurR-regulated permease PerM